MTMNTKEITIIGKKVTLAYNYATEIAYKNSTDEDIEDYMKEAVAAVQESKSPDVKKTIYCIIASMLSYYESKGEDSPVSDNDLMFECTPQELGVALGTIIALRAQFYHVPNDEPKDNQEENEPKNV